MHVGNAAVVTHVTDQIEDDTCSVFLTGSDSPNNISLDIPKQWCEYFNYRLQGI